MTTASPFRLDGLTALVSGAGGGIGRAIVAAFGAAGARVTGADRTVEMLDGLSLAGELLFDLADTAATRSAVAHYLRTGVPDIVVANAGFTRAETLDDLDQASWEREVALNLNGTYAMTAPIVEAMAARGSGRRTGCGGTGGGTTCSSSCPRRHWSPRRMQDEERRVRHRACTGVLRDDSLQRQNTRKTMTTASPFRLDGLTALVSGAGGGIGRAIVAAFGAAGARVTGA
ncbi:MAG TPA: SDR family NAD(P)-dependent oxidoreductase, partial [Devosia sp.]|nr:SDR family NAD(P)-dependent oxidoreductase [Devosia sp.]